MSVKVEEWVVLELMGHRKFAGRISEAQRFGVALAKLEVFSGDEEQPSFVQEYHPQAIYCLTPCTEELARQYSKRNRPVAISRYELMDAALPACDDEEEGDWDDAEYEEESRPF